MPEASFYTREPQCLTTPLVDIYETETEVIVTAEMPGVSKDQMQIEAIGRELTIQGSIRNETEGRRLMREFPPCNYFRTFQLSEAIDTQNIQASVAHGVLTLTLPKHEVEVPYEIPIETV